MTRSNGNESGRFRRGAILGFWTTLGGLIGWFIGLVLMTPENAAWKMSINQDPYSAGAQYVAIVAGCAAGVLVSLNGRKAMRVVSVFLAIYLLFLGLRLLNGFYVNYRRNPPELSMLEFARLSNRLPHLAQGGALIVAAILFFIQTIWCFHGSPKHGEGDGPCDV